MKGLCLAEILPDHPKIAEIQRLWLDFFTLYESLHIAKTPEDAAQFDVAAKSWVHKCCNDVYLAKNAICYMHLLGYHVSTMIALHGNFSIFAQQKFEYLNHELTQAYFRSSNHQQTAALVQVMQKHNRIISLKDSSSLPKNSYCCTVCHSESHKRTSCPNRQPLRLLN